MSELSEIDSQVRAPSLSVVQTNLGAEQSRQFGFLRFETLEDSTYFMDRNHPQIYIYGQSSTGDDQSAKVSIAYSRERGERRGDPNEGEWICKIVRIYKTLLGCLF